MENTFDKAEEITDMTDREMFTKIWTSPRSVFRFINDRKYDLDVKTLLIWGAISQLGIKLAGDTDQLVWILLVVYVIFCFLFSKVVYYLFSIVIRWTGRWFGGQGDTKSILRTLAYAMIPSIASIVISVIQLALYGDRIFRSPVRISGESKISELFFDFTSAISFGLGLWTVVLAVIGISLVQKISIIKSILNLMLSVVIIILTPIVLISLYILYNRF